jgi:putative membrane protein
MRVLQIVKIIILAAWAAFFGWLATFGQQQLGRLLHPSLWWLVGAATVVLILFLAVNLCRQLPAAHQGDGWLKWPALLILLVPLLYFIPAQSGRFGAETLAKRGIQTTAGFIPQAVNTKAEDDDNGYPPPLPPRKADTDIPLPKLAMNPENYEGQEVEIVCKTFVDERLPSDLFMCYRYLITCCAADAMPVFVFVKYPEARSVKNDQWIRAKGAFSRIENAQIMVPSIQTEKVEYIDEPPFPYLF